MIVLYKNALKLILFGFISKIGSKIFSFACAFYILNNTENSYLYSLYLALVVLTTVFSTPIAGVFIDKLNNKRLVLYSQLTSVITLGLFAFVYNDNIYLIVVLGIILNIPDGINGIIIQKNLKEIVTKDFERIISIRQTINTVMNFVVPILGGVLVGFIPLQLLGAFNLFTEAISILLLQSLPILNHKQVKNKFLPLFKEGVQYLAKKKNIVLILSTGLIVNFLVNSTSVGVPIIAIQQLKLTSTQFGTLESGYTLSIFIVSLILSIYPPKRKVDRYFKLSVIIQVIVLSALGWFLMFPHSQTVSFIFFIIMNMLLGSSTPISNIAYSIYLQNQVEAEYKGRVFSLNQAVAQSIIPISLGIFGLILNKNAGLIYLIVAALMLITLIIFSVLWCKFKFE